jgi:hypothetical protein
MEKSPEFLQLLRLFPTFYGTTRFVTVYTPPPVPILSQINPGQTLTNDVFKIHSYIMLPFIPRSSKRSLSFRFPHQISICTSLAAHTCYMPRSSHSFWLHCPINILWEIQIMTFLNMQSPPVPCYLVPLKPKYLSHRRILEHPQPMLPPLCDRPRFTPTQKSAKLHLCIL